MGTIDTLMSGYVSTRDLAAVAIGSAVWTPVWLFLAGVMLSLSPAIAGAASAGRRHKVAELLGSGITLGLITGTLLAIITTTAGYLMPGFVDDQQTAHTAELYLYAIACAMPASGIFLAHRFHAEAVDQAHHVTRIMLAGLVLNVPINAVFIYGWFGLPALGGVGCGIGSAIVVTLMTIALHLDSRKFRNCESFPILRFPSFSRIPQGVSLANVGIPIGVGSLFVG
ncbi:MAG: MATE family efflux transporter, partial [Thalassolituus sp.]